MTEKFVTEDASLKAMTTTSVQRSRRWAFTLASVDVEEKIELSNATLYIGPTEKDAWGVLHRHGVALGKQLENGREASIGKLSLLKQMEKLGLKVTYLASIRSMANYISYAYKGGEIPEELRPIIKNTVKGSRATNYFQDLAKEVASEFQDKPSANLFKQRILEKCFAYPQALLKRAYEQCDFGEESRLQRKIRKRTKALEPEPFTTEELRAAFWRITENIETAMWNGRSLSIFQVRVIMISAAMEARSRVDGMQLAPHFIVKGEAGSGKTFLGNLLFTTKEASTLTTDSEGVGQLTLRIGHKVLKVDDAGQTTLTSKRMVDTFKTCYQNNWSAKEHGCRQDNTSTCIWITTNVKTSPNINGV